MVTINITYGLLGVISAAAVAFVCGALISYGRGYRQGTDDARYRLEKYGSI